MSDDIGRDVELVVVAYRSRPQVEQLLVSVGARWRVCVVDNFDGSDGLQDIVLARPGGRYLAGGGVGFARAANLGARTSTADVVVFVNPDTRPVPADLETLVEDVAANHRCVSSAATLVGPDGRAELGAGGWEPSLPRALAHAAGLHKRWPTVGLFARPVLGRPISVDWTSGGCMAVRRQTFCALGAFDEAFYVYSEDVAFGRTVRESGLEQRLRTDVAVPSSSGGSGAPSLEMMRLRGASLSRYVRRHHHQPVATAISAVVAAGYLVRTLEHLVRRDRQRAREHWAYAVGAVTARASVAGVEVLG